MALLSSTDCKFCLTGTNLQRFKFPCECLIHAHPDCYIEYTDTRKRIDYDLTVLGIGGGVGGGV